MQCLDDLQEDGRRERQHGADVVPEQHLHTTHTEIGMLGHEEVGRLYPRPIVQLCI